MLPYSLYHEPLETTSSQSRKHSPPGESNQGNWQMKKYPVRQHSSVGFNLADEPKVAKNHV